MKTFMAKESEFQREWHLVDASQLPVGRLAARIAQILMGKHKPTYTPHVDTGDYVVVTNAKESVLTGRKAEQRVYRHHTGYIGGLKEISHRRMMEEHPERVIRLAVRRMLPKSTLGRHMLSKLKIYEGAEHPHAAQQPKPLSL
ncbi:MAG: 50S ribosomal protein L13 [Planctomycetes bacterium]|nr:50S ribosomal protein L13 [Planctomycetota bacterium]